MKRGRKPKSREQRIQEGNPGRRPLPPERAVAPAPDDLTPPAWLTSTARDFWGRHAERLAVEGVLTVDTVDTFAVLCRMFARFATLPDGDKAEKDARETYLRLAEQFGLMPSNRAGAPAAAPHRESEIERFKASTRAQRSGKGDGT